MEGTAWGTLIKRGKRQIVSGTRRARHPRQGKHTSERDGSVKSVKVSGQKNDKKKKRRKKTNGDGE